MHNICQPTTVLTESTGSLKTMTPMWRVLRKLLHLKTSRNKYLRLSFPTICFTDGQPLFDSKMELIAMINIFPKVDPIAYVLFEYYDNDPKESKVIIIFHTDSIVN